MSKDKVPSYLPMYVVYMCTCTPSTLEVCVDTRTYQGQERKRRNPGKRAHHNKHVRLLVRLQYGPNKIRKNPIEKIKTSLTIMSNFQTSINFYNIFT